MYCAKIDGEEQAGEDVQKQQMMEEGQPKLYVMCR